MFPDFKELLSAFNAHRVRATRDLDLLISADAENARAVYAALAAFGAPLQGLTAEDLIEPGSFFRMGRPPVMVDILPRISGVDFEEAWQRRVDVAIDDTLNVPFISREDLIAAKLAAGRPQDLADAVALSEDQHKVREEPPRLDTAASDPLEEVRSRARVEWLKLRQSPAATPEETRAKGREEWLRLRQQQAENAPGATDEAHKERSSDLRRTEFTKDLDAGFDDDTDA